MKESRKLSTLGKAKAETTKVEKVMKTEKVMKVEKDRENKRRERKWRIKEKMKDSREN